MTNAAYPIDDTLTCARGTSAGLANIATALTEATTGATLDGQWTDLWEHALAVPREIVEDCAAFERAIAKHSKRGSS